MTEQEWARCEELLPIQFGTPPEGDLIAEALWFWLVRRPELFTTSLESEEQDNER